mgnify:CR=1 FL=1
MERPIFDSRSPLYKTPFGAVPCGRHITLTLYPPVEENFTGGALILNLEFAGEIREIPLVPAPDPSASPEAPVSETAAADRTGSDSDTVGGQGGAAAPEGAGTVPAEESSAASVPAVFTVAYTAPAEPELIWYCFRFTRQDGSAAFLGKNGLCGEGQAACWQQTVYDDQFSTPEWFGRGVTYQIFPDRFHRTFIPDPAGMLGDRIVHQNWEELMDYLPDEHGEIRNRDFFGGSLMGIEEKLPYLKELGVRTLYLCPIFESDSNHRYNTGDYDKIDPMLGTEEDFTRLCTKAHALGIRVMLDGVFNHTGNNSRYFNALGAYPSLGAAQSQESPYYPWYNFQEWPHRYDCWWGIHTLPAVNESHPEYIDFIIEGKDAVIRRWLRAGADAWRLDVADELPDEFIARIRRVMMEEKAESFLLGEVWEDGSNKIAYSKRRKYLLGRETHGLMNYPFRVSAMDYLRGGDAAAFRDAMETIRENYPRPAFYSCMNMLGTHDNPRILTLLGTFPKEAPHTRTERAHYRMSPEEYHRGCRLLQTGAIILYAFPGSPTIFYGDEAGMEGYEDPFNRGTFPWGHEDRVLQRRFALLGSLRNNRLSLQKGDIRWLYAQGHGLAFARTLGDEVTIAATNAGDEPVFMTFDWSGDLATDALTGQQFLTVNGKITICLPPLDGVLLV